uniref:BSD domain-containing protein n=1 Tax=Arundo donax TaxID=35708 RepID=A0A0A9FZD3_ARUDO
MSWFARSLATSLNIPNDSSADDDPDAAAATTATPSSSTRIPPPPPPPHPLHSAAAEGVKEDLTELSKTLTRQFWGVANFLAPPPGETSPSPSPSPQSAGDQSGAAEAPPEIAGIRSDFAEIGGRFKSGISRISSHKAVSGFSRLASNFFAPEDDEEDEWEDERRQGIRYETREEEEVRHEVGGDDLWHEWEDRVSLEVDDGELRHELVSGHELEVERVRHEEDSELERQIVRHEENGELDEQRVRHKEDGELEGRVRCEEDAELEEERVRHEEEVVEEDWDVIGITEEVLAFAKNIARHPETWLDYPLLPDDDESDGPFSYFDMSDAQQEHALAIEHLSPRLAALRIELCPIHMSEECFWKIYFVLLHPRLNKHDAELLSTPQIVEARAMLMQRLHYQSKLETEQLCHHKHDRGFLSEEDTLKDSTEAFPSMRQEAATVVPLTEFEIDKHTIQVTEVAVVDKSVITEHLPKDHTETSNFLPETFDDDIDDWFDEEADLAGHPTIHIDDEEDVSFSDLEDDVK